MRNALLTTAAALLISGAPAAAQVAAPAADAEAGAWTAWYGCWQPTMDDAAAQGDDMVCVLPGADALTARMAWVEGGAIIDDVMIQADGQSHPVSDGGCTGTESAAFSPDGHRVYTSTQMSCQGVARTANGVFAMTAENEWVDVEAITVAGEATGRTVRYLAVHSDDVPAAIAALLPTGQRMMIEAVRLDAAGALGIEDVVEMSAAVGAPATEALLGARRQGFGLDARTLAQLEDAGVAATTIDVMVALSYPDRFVVHESRGGGAGGGGSAYLYDRDSMLRDYCNDIYATNRSYRNRTGLVLGNDCDTYGYGARGYGYGRGSYGFVNPYYYYDRYGYGPYGWGPGAGPIVIVDPSRPRVDLDTGGQVTRDGYTRGAATPRGTAVPRSSTTRRPTAVTPRSSRTGTTTRSTPPSTTTKPTRTAKPRPPGGGGGNDSGGV